MARTALPSGRREGIAQNLYYRWSKDFLEAGKKRLAGDTARAATSDEVNDLRREAMALKEVVADLTLENRVLKKAYGWRRNEISAAELDYHRRAYISRRRSLAIGSQDPRFIDGAIFIRLEARGAGRSQPSA